METRVVKLCISHNTTYSYSGPVTLGTHRLMLRPRESRDVRLLSMDLRLMPQATVVWTHDVAGNMVATATFGPRLDRLEIHSTVELELDAAPWPIFLVAAHAIAWPFQYTLDELIDLGPLIMPQYCDDAGQLREWVQGFVRSNPTDTLALLKDINSGISGWVSYQSRDSEGTQGPVDTLERGWGACRDFAVLFIEAVRTLGFGARIVSGYLRDSLEPGLRFYGTGSTHAWAEVYVPGAGWITFDPTNGTVGGANLIPVAVGRSIAQVMPVTGTFAGKEAFATGMSIDVSVVERY